MSAHIKKPLNEIVESLGHAIRSKQDAKNQPNTFIDTIENNQVTKSNALARACYRYSLVEKRVIETLISRINPLSRDIKQLKDIELNAIEYASMFDLGVDLAYKQLSEAVDGLLSKTITIKQETYTHKFPLMSEARYIEREGRITCSFNTHSICHLIGLREAFTTYPLCSAREFSSAYSWRLYELIMSWSKNERDGKGKKDSGWFAIGVEDLRDAMGVPISYKWSHFQDQILETAIKEIKQHAGIIVSITRKKSGRKISELKIEFKQGPK